VRAAIGCIVVLTVTIPLFGDSDAAAATVGALLVALPSISSSARRPVATMAATTAGLALATWVGSSTGSNSSVHLVVLGLWAFAGGMLVALGDTGSLVGTQATMAFVVFGRFAESPRSAAELAAYVAAGGLVQILLVEVTRWPTSLMDQRRAVGAAYRGLADLARGGTSFSSIPAGSALDDAERSLESPSLFRRHDVSMLQSLLDEGRRVRIELSALEALRTQLDRVSSAPRIELDTAVDEVLSCAATALEDIAEAVVGGVRPPSPTLALPLSTVKRLAADIASTAPDHLERASEDPRAQSGSTGSAGGAVAQALVDRLTALAGQLRAAAVLAVKVGSDASTSLDRDGGPRILQRLADSVAAQIATLRANFTLASTSCRHAIRLAVVVVAAELIATHSGLQRGYWIALTAALVLRPDFGTTYSRGMARFAGTCLGVGITGLLVIGSHVHGAVAVVVIGILCLGGFASFRASYAVFSAFLTGVVVLLVNLASPGAHSSLATAGDRLLDTAIGGGLALVVYALWPSWTTDAARDSLVTLAKSVGDYLDAVLASITGTRRLTETEARRLARRLRLARTNCEAVVARSLAEPQVRRVDGPRSSRTLAGLRRISLTTHVLRTTALSASASSSSGEAASCVPELKPLHQAIDEMWTVIVEGLDTELPSRPQTRPLRQLYDELVDAVAGRDATSLLLVEMDELVDAVNTLTSIATTPAPAVA